MASAFQCNQGTGLPLTPMIAQVPRIKTMDSKRSAQVPETSLIASLTPPITSHPTNCGTHAYAKDSTQKHLHQNLGNRILIFNQFVLLTPLCQLTPLPHPLCQSSQWGAIARQCLASDPGAT